MTTRRRTKPSAIAIDEECGEGRNDSSREEDRDRVTLPEVVPPRGSAVAESEQRNRTPRAPSRPSVPSFHGATSSGRGENKR
jgi:hypothetical protein